MDRPFEVLTDEALVAASLKGDDGSFAELIKRHKRRVVMTASRFARDAQELDDISQDVFIKAFRNLSKFRGEAPFGHWLSKITVRTCYDLLRARTRDRENIPLDSVDFALEGPSTGDEVSAWDARRILGRALPMLKPDERLVITLVELEERSVREVSELTGWSESNVKVRAFRARKALKEILGYQDETR